MDERTALRKAFRDNPKLAEMLRGMLEKGQLKAPDDNPDEPLMVICKRWPGLVDDCRMALCSFCGFEVALAPSSQEIVAKSKVEAKYCCMECFAEGAVQRYEAAEKAREAALKLTGK